MKAPAVIVAILFNSGIAFGQEVYHLDVRKIQGLVPPASNKYIIICNGYKSNKYVLSYKGNDQWDTLTIKGNSYAKISKKTVTTRIYYSQTAYTEATLRSNAIYSVEYDRPKKQWIIVPTNVE